MSITQAKARLPDSFRKGTKVYLVNVLDLQFPTFIKAEIDNYNDDETFDYLFDNKIDDAITKDAGILSRVC